MDLDRARHLIFNGVVKGYASLGFLRRCLRHLDKQVLFFPEYPGGFNYVIVKTIRCAGVVMRPFSRSALLEPSERPLLRLLLRLLGNGSHLPLIVAFEDNTRSLVDVTAYLQRSERLPRPLHVLNHRCTDISKRAVSRLFAEVFGYSIEVNPQTHEGPMVRKADCNGIHDGEVLTGPIPNPSTHGASVYQRLVNNAVDTVYAEDLRVIVVGDDLPFVYRKQRPLSSRFSNTNSKVDIEQPERVFSADELSKLRSFAAGIGLDLGELDILRDRDDQRMYIVDVNKTVSGPPNKLSLVDTLRAIRGLADAFEREVLSRIGDYRLPGEA